MASGRQAVVVLALLVACLLASPVRAGGFAFYEQGSKAMGMAGAFVAQADDPTAIFYNPAGLALLEDQKGAVGLTVHSLNESLYQGLPPGIGAGTASEQDVSEALQPHIYVILPLGSSFKVGIGITSPFSFETGWTDPGSFAGRGIATAAQLKSYDLNPSVGYALSPKIGLGFGLIYRTSEFRLDRRFFADNPFTGASQDVASLATATDFSDGIGWSAGVLHRLSDRFSWGFSYRSAIAIDYGVTGRLTQISTGNDQLDALFAASLPFDQDFAASTAIDFPQTAVLGVAYGISDRLLAEVDLHWTGWRGLDRLAIESGTFPLFDHVIRQDFADTLSIRLGVQLTTATGTHYRVGLALDESPQPDATLGPFFHDATSTVIALGFGKKPLDLAFVWIDSEQRVISNQVDGINGNYRMSAWKLGLTLSM